MKKFTPITFLKLKLGPLAILFALVFTAVSCDTEDTIQPDQELLTSLEAIPAELKKLDGNQAGKAANAKNQRKPTFNTLLVALAKTGLTPTVAKEKLTLFAPSDEAFEKLGLNPSNVGSVPNLKEILLYHAVAGEVYAADLKAGFIPTLNGAALEISLANGAMVNGADVLLVDARALNGVIHVIDEVLMPPTANLVELAISLQPEFSILVEAVVRAGLAGTLAEGGPFTVFAPTNQAFENLLRTLGYANINQVPENVLKQVLLYHVLSGRVYSSDLSTGDVRTVNGDTFFVNLADLTLTDTQKRKANLQPSLLNVQATNGVVHVINEVLLPNIE